MPSKTFYNLPNEKREKLMSSIKGEFSRVPFEEVSINRIIHAAEISRGSFYQYFSDKIDMLKYILLDYQQQMLEQIINSLNTNKGDIFKMFDDIFSFSIEFGSKKEMSCFCQKLFADLKINGGFYSELPIGDEHLHMLLKLLPKINLDSLDLKTEEDFVSMLEIIISITRDATVEVFQDISNCDHIKQKYLNKITLLKRGFLKDKCTQV